MKSYSGRLPGQLTAGPLAPSAGGELGCIFQGDDVPGHPAVHRLAHPERGDRISRMLGNSVYVEERACPASDTLPGRHVPEDAGGIDEESKSQTPRLKCGRCGFGYAEAGGPAGRAR